jgi:hypothetical protein
MRDLDHDHRQEELMDRALLKLVQLRLTALEKALLDQVSARASGVDGAHVGSVTAAHQQLDAALQLWRDWLAQAGTRNGGGWA